MPMTRHRSQTQKLISTGWRGQKGWDDMCVPCNGDVGVCPCPCPCLCMCMCHSQALVCCLSLFGGCAHAYPVDHALHARNGLRNSMDVEFISDSQYHARCLAVVILNIILLTGWRCGTMPSMGHHNAVNIHDLAAPMARIIYIHLLPATPTPHRYTKLSPSSASQIFFLISCLRRTPWLKSRRYQTSFALLMYDTLLTLPSEIRHIWGKTVKIGIILYLFARYMPLGLFLVNTYLTLSNISLEYDLYSL
ncbi:hypothetical protein JB92DRAFT_455012 [Gautieria morchelliformis]|nr:hypothetical protein JB92DRAFT_455012 [Gautieria morchelliformis]